MRNSYWKQSRDCWVYNEEYPLIDPPDRLYTLGERNIVQVGGVYLILRTSWLYSLRRGNFVTRVLEWSRQQTVMRVVSDQVGNPTWARMLAEATAQLLARAQRDVYAWIKEHRSIYHLAGSGACSRYEWAREILRCDPEKDKQVTQQIMPSNWKDFHTLARRPLFSALDCTHFFDVFGMRLPDWKVALQMAMEIG